MQDRFKFRVWLEYAKLYYDLDSFYYDKVKSKYTFHFEDGHTKTLKEKDCVIEQCTGLKDKNGRLIYEGDILGGVCVGFIKWCDECKSFSMFYGEHCFSCNGDILWAEIVEKDGDLEVIGNIHENPESAKED